MALELLSWLSALLVVLSIAVKIVTAHILAQQKQDLAKLQAEARQRRTALESLVEHRESLEDNLEFYERRLTEERQVHEQLSEELKGYDEVQRCHLESLGYDPDEEPLVGTIPPAAPALAAAGPGPEAPAAPAAPEFGAEAIPGWSPTLAVVPAAGDADKLFLPDAIVTELLALGARVVERSLLAQRLHDAGDDLARALDREEYRRLGAAGVDAIAIVNSRLRGRGVGTATCRVVRLPAGEILLSATYEQPGRDEVDPAFETLTQTARRLAGSIRAVLQPEPASR